MKILAGSMTRNDLRQMAENSFGGLVKAVVDVDRGLIALDADLHADLETLLLSEGSSQNSLWGINLYPEQAADQFIEFDSMINVRPYQNNRSRFVEDEHIRQRIVAVVSKWIAQ